MIKKTLALLATATAIGTTSLQAASVEEITASTSVAFESEYIFRGIKQYSESIQPGVDVSMPMYDGDVYLGYWGSYPMDNNDGSGLGHFSESDVYFGYSQKIADIYSMDMGYTYYSFDNPGAGLLNRWHEIYFGISADYFDLSPALYIYHNFSLDSWIIEANIAYSYDIGMPNTSLEVGAYVGHWTMDDSNGDQVSGNPNNSFNYWGLNADLVYSPNEVTNLSIGARYAGNDDGAEGNSWNLTPGSGPSPDSHLWWGAAASLGF